MYKIVFWRLNSEKSELTGSEKSIGNLIELLPDDVFYVVFDDDGCEFINMNEDAKSGYDSL